MPQPIQTGSLSGPIPPGPLPPVSEELLRALPKTDLHCHLDGSLRLATILELARQQGVRLPADTPDGLAKAISMGVVCGTSRYIGGAGASHPGILPDMLRHLGAFVVRLLVSTVVLWAAVGWVSPRNPYNTVGRALLVSLFLSLASYLTLARFLWFLLLPWLLYAFIWLATVMSAYGIGFASALLLAIALTLLSALVSLVFGLRGL